jgi:hypothetical protein
MNAIPRFWARLSCLALTLLCNTGKAQQCSHEALTSKYWQYRENLKHFVMNDRKPEGCIGNGITRLESDLSQLSCNTDLLNGYGLPATSITMTPNGGFGMGAVNDDESVFFNQNCANAGPSPGTSYNPPGPGHSGDFTDVGFNFLEYGSETPHQIGWYLVTLATEYALLGKNGQLAEQERTLEDLFLALQAYRRLDIAANCLVRERYDEITAGTEICLPNTGNVSVESCLCPPKYVNAQCDNWQPWKWNFDIPCNTTCPWPPDLSGYSGFFIREDAVQEQEGLQDTSEDKWNIDLVGGAFAMSQIPPCDPTFSPACYMERSTGYLSQDQMFSVLTGLAAVKAYIPPEATVTTCDGQVYKPFDIVQDIAKGFVDLPQNTTRHIFWPGSPDEDCCTHAIKFSECAGGNFQGTYAGLEYMFNFINEEAISGNKDHKIGLIDRTKWGPKFGRKVWFSAAMGVSLDIGDMPHPNKFTNATIDSEKEIFLLMNDLFHPEDPNLVGDDDDFSEYKAIFEQMLCDAPCEGPCIKPADYDAKKAAGLLAPYQVLWPEFSCPNTPGWTGQRWEGNSGGPDWGDVRDARQFNGLDFMALYNLYMLRYPEEQTPYYNPVRPEPTTSGHLLGENQIEGPSTLCPGQSGNYGINLVNNNGQIRDIIDWTSSNNIQLSNRIDNSVTDRITAQLMSAQTPTFIQVEGSENRELDQHWNPGNLSTTIPNGASEHCDFSYQKPIVTETPNYDIDLIIDECTWNYQANVFGSPIYDGITFDWTATDNLTGYSINHNGPYFDFFRVMPIGLGEIGTVTITLVIHSSCGNITKTVTAPYQTCNDPWEHRQIIINPNPTNNQVSIYIIKNQSQDFITTDPNGVRIQIYPANGGSTSLLDSYLYNNGQYFNVSSLPNGVYQVRASAADLTPIQANLSIIH